MSDVQIIGASEFEDSETCGRVCDGGVWEVRIPAVWSDSAGFITGPTNFWKTDRSLIRDLIEECKARGFDPTGKPVQWINVRMTPDVGSSAPSH